jgi:hypothetical protein
MKEVPETINPYESPVDCDNVASAPPNWAFLGFVAGLLATIGSVVTAVVIAFVPSDSTVVKTATFAAFAFFLTAMILIQEFVKFVERKANAAESADGS